MEQNKVTGTQRIELAGTSSEVTAVSRELLNQQERQLHLQISTEKNYDRMVVLVTELNDLLQSQHEKKPSAEKRFDEISVSHLPQSW